MVPEFLRTLEYTTRIARALQSQLSRVPGLSGTLAPVADPLLALPQHIHSLAGSMQIKLGHIADQVAYTRFYRVMLEDGAPLLGCCMATDGSVTPVGVASGTTLPPDTPVVVLKHHSWPYGIILAALPNYMIDGTEAISDFIFQGSAVGAHTDPANTAALLLGPPGSNGGVIDFSSRSPVDSVELGEFVKIAETGLCLSLDSFFAQLRVDEATGLFLFYHDQLCRLAGYNLQLWSSGLVEESLDDEGEHQFYRGLATYPWEQLGLLGGPGTAATENDAETCQNKKPYYSRIEPAADDLQPFHRLQTWAGYLGQAFHRFLAAPPDADQYSLSGADKIPGMVEEFWTLSGHVALRSVNGITIAKRPAISVPRRKKSAVDTTGDSAENYSASGQYGNGEQHQVNGRPYDKTGEAGLAHIMDMHAYLFNWQGSHPFYYHRNDFDLPEEAETPAGTNMVVPDFSKLRDLYELPPPDPTYVTVDHRYGQQAIYPTYSYWSILDDGAQAWGDGYGAEVRMAGGNVVLDAPGDLFLRAGRNIVLWAGRDVIARAKNSTDITCSEGDFRAKAQKNVQIISANGGGPYGLLLESRATEKTLNFDEPGEKTKHAGIILSARQSQVLTLGGDIYFRTGGAGGQPANIVLDADKGNARVIMHAAAAERYLKNGAFDYFGTEDNIEGSTAWTATGAVISGYLVAEGPAVLTGSVTVKGGISVVEGHISTEQAVSNDRVSELRGESLAAAKSQVSQGSSSLNTMKNTGRQQYRQNLEQPFYKDNKPGDDDLLQKVKASLRTDDDYKANSFILYEPRWSQMVVSAETWTEPPVSSAAGDTYPYPGKKRLVDEAALYPAQLVLYDHQTGTSSPRGSGYEQVTEPEDSPVPINGNYKITG